MRRALVVGVVVAALAGAGAAADGGAAGAGINTRICKQIKGPVNDWLLPASVASRAGVPRQVKGTTWTVFATGVPCATAVKLAPVFLKQWAKLYKTHGRVRITGWLCSIDRNQGKSGSDGGGCVGGSPGDNFQVIATGRYTIAQLRTLGMGR